MGAYSSIDIAESKARQMIATWAFTEASRSQLEGILGDILSDRLLAPIVVPDGFFDNQDYEME